jgi:hypothetical protein
MPEYLADSLTAVSKSDQVSELFGIAKPPVLGFIGFFEIPLCDFGSGYDCQHTQFLFNFIKPIFPPPYMGINTVKIALFYAIPEENFLKSER